jgi:hypothetical protein
MWWAAVFGIVVAIGVAVWFARRLKAIEAHHRAQIAPAMS